MSMLQMMISNDNVDATHDDQNDNIDVTHDDQQW